MFKKIYLVTVLHPWNDNRIFNKILKSSIDAGKEIIYIAPNLPTDELDIDCRLIPLSGKTRSRLARVLWIVKKLIRKEKSIFHFHDPELIPAGFILRLFGWKVIYDVHEDYFLSLKQRSGSAVKNRLLAYCVRLIERLCEPVFELVLAESVYKNVFKDGIEVLNFPVRKSFTRTINRPRCYRAIYSGVVSRDRGALYFSKFLEAFPEYQLTIVGRCTVVINHG